LSWISRNNRAFWIAIGEGLEQRDLLFRESADIFPADEDRPDRPALPKHRRKDDRLVADDQGSAPGVVRNVGVLDVGVVHDSAPQYRGTGAGLVAQGHGKVALTRNERMGRLPRLYVMAVTAAKQIMRQSL
jgi:hypothetical protein